MPFKGIKSIANICDNHKCKSTSDFIVSGLSFIVETRFLNCMLLSLFFQFLVVGESTKLMRLVGYGKLTINHELLSNNFINIIKKFVNIEFSNDVSRSLHQRRESETSFERSIFSKFLWNINILSRHSKLKC